MEITQMSGKLLYFPNPRVATEIVQWARLFSVCDMGQITTMQRRELDRAVAAGYLVKGKGGPYPVLLNVYAHPGYDFAEERVAEIAAIEYLKKSVGKAA
jgi:hypothetical protein